MKKLLIPALAALAGCGTIADTACSDRRDPGPHVFGGVQYDWKMVHGGLCCIASAAAPCFVFDLPLSAAADVLMLPVSVPVGLVRPRAP